MGIWRVVTGQIYCDNCEKLIATIEFDAADTVNIERIHAWCVDCRRSPEATPPQKGTEL